MAMERYGGKIHARSTKLKYEKSFDLIEFYLSLIRTNY